MPNVITRISNPVEFHEADPEIETHHDALYLPIAGPEPWETNHGWGLFDHDGRLIEAAAYHRGPGKTLLGQCERIDPSAYDISDSDETVIYVGTYIDHFGHFLLTTVARLWADETFGFRDARLLGHGAGVPPGWLSHPYARQLLAAIDVDATHFVPPSGPIRFKTVIVPRPSLEEHNFVHSAYKRICGTIGDRLLLSAKKKNTDRPISRNRSYIKVFRDLLTKERSKTSWPAMGSGSYTRNTLRFLSRSLCSETPNA